VVTVDSSFSGDLHSVRTSPSAHIAKTGVSDMSVFAMCAEGDVRTECKSPEKELSTVTTTRKRPARCVEEQDLES
jgi:DEAD/DEAH box helicase domain-containing protein